MNETRDIEADLAEARRLLEKWPEWFEADCEFICFARITLPHYIERAKAAEAFKSWVHAWLDGRGVPHDPDPVHTAKHGCRISGRMVYLLNRAKAAEAHVKELEEEAINERGWQEVDYECLRDAKIPFHPKTTATGMAIAEVERLRKAIEELEAKVTELKAELLSRRAEG